MKLFQNPVVVGGMVVVAGALMFRNLLGPGRRHSGRPPAGARAAAAPHPKTAAPAAIISPAPRPLARTLATNRIDRSLVRANWPRWLQSPQRDPFQGRSPVRGPSAESAARRLTLSSILRQTGSSVAVVNQRVVSQGELVAGFRVEKIGADYIWVWGPNGRERLGFKQGLPFQLQNNSKVTELAHQFHSPPAP